MAIFQRFLRCCSDVWQDAFCINKSGQSNKKQKFVMAASTYEELNKWKATLGDGHGGGKTKGDKGAMNALAAAGGGSDLSEHDFYVTLSDKSKARLSVTGTHIQTYVSGKKVDDHDLKVFKSWRPKDTSLEFYFSAGGKWVVKTKQGQDIIKAINSQAVKYKTELDRQAKERRDQEAAAARKAEEEAAAAAAEAAKWLTLEELQSGNYARCSRQPVDEKNKELWLSDADFELHFKKTKAEWEKVPPFRRPMVKKKLGLQPL
eukprot:SAG31_NODE_350_length_17241_cov_156.139715_2_plen_261_part_00